MSTTFGNAELRLAARCMARQMAETLPEEETVPSDGFTAQMLPLLRQAERRRTASRARQRAAAAALTAVLALGTVAAVSPEARAAVTQWFRKATTVVTTYWFPPSGESKTWTGDGPSWLPTGYAVVSDFTDSDGIRTIRCTSPQGDVLLQSIPLGGGALSMEIRSSLTDGLSDLTGQRPQGEPGDPEGYTMTERQVCGRDAQLYAFDTPPEGARGESAFAVRVYLDGVYVHHAALAAHSRLLMWADEEAGQVFLLFGSPGQEELCRMAESMYAERSGL